MVGMGERIHPTDDFTKQLIGGLVEQLSCELMKPEVRDEFKALELTYRANPTRTPRKLRLGPVTISVTRNKNS